MVLSYPYNPVCSVADDSVYEKAIEFAKKYDILIIHDNAYSDIIYDGKRGKSFLSYEGAKEVGVEFFSLSKSFNVTGLRISFLIGKKEVVDAMKLLRSQIDFGMPLYDSESGESPLLTDLWIWWKNSAGNMKKEGMHCAEVSVRLDGMYRTVREPCLSGRRSRINFLHQNSFA